MQAFLNVEDPNNQYVEFQRNYETTALPSAPSQPLIHKITSKSLTLTWQSSSHSGHSPIRSYTVEYFSPEWTKSAPGWTILAEAVTATSFTVNNLQPDMYYMFVVRARNDQGYGPPSSPSDLIRTAFESQHFLFSNKNSNEILEKALTGEIVQLNDPPQVLGSSSINVTWRVLKSAYLIEGFYLKYKAIGAKEYQTQKVANKQVNSHVLVNLHKFTSYEFLIEPYAGAIRGSESNIVQARTAEDAPSHSPNTIHVEIASLTSLSIKWQPPPSNHMNGVIIGYKVSCAGNDTKSSITVNTNSTSRSIMIANLAEYTKYCVRVAAYTRAGAGPYSSPRCVEINAANLLKAQASHESEMAILTKQHAGSSSSIFGHRLFGETWFVSVVIVASALGLMLFFYLVWCLVRKRGGDSHRKKFLSSSENCSLTLQGNGGNSGGTMAQHITKIDQMGNRYKLVNDTIWLDTMHSNSNNSNPECCCVPDLHHQLYLQQSKSN